MRNVNYDQIAANYDQRYFENSLVGVQNSLIRLGNETSAKKILEVGCGTGHWLKGLTDSLTGAQIYGLDFSEGMLTKAKHHSTPLHLVRGKGSQLPLQTNTFDLLFCVNALHHFYNPGKFVAQAQQVLRPGGTLAIIGQVPHDRRNHWFVYDYFEGTFDRDLGRFPTWGTVMDWMVCAGFHQIQWEPIEWITDHKYGWDVLDDPFLQQHAVSQLAILSDNAYTDGIEKIKKAIRTAESIGQTIEFNTQLRLDLITAQKTII